MRRIFPFLLTFIFIGCVPGLMYDSDTMVTDSPTMSAKFKSASKVTVIPFSGKNGELVSDLFSMQLSNVQGLQVVERYQLSNIIQEHALSQTGFLNETSAIEAGKILGIDAIFSGSVSMSVGWGTWEGVNMTVKMIDVETGSILWHALGESTWMGSVTGNAEKAATEVVKKFKQDRSK